MNSDDQTIARSDLYLALSDLLSSSEFTSKPQLARLLSYLITETIENRDVTLEQYRIATQALGRGPEFNPKEDGIVRTEASRLRKVLAKYYDGPGADQRIHVDLPTGGYVPRFRRINHAGEKESSRDTNKETEEVIEEAVAADAASGETPPAGSEKDVPAADTKDRPALPSEEAPLPAPTISVFPFTNLDGDGGLSDIFVDAIGEDLTRRLCVLQDLSVFAYQSTSAALYHGMEPMDFARRFGVDYLVLGGAARTSQRLRVHVEVISAASREPVWSQQFDRPWTAEQFFQIQDEILEQTTTAVGRVSGIFPGQPAASSPGKRPDDLAVYESILRARRSAGFGCPDLEEFADCLKGLLKAVAADPDCAIAWALLSKAYGDEHAHGYLDLENALSNAESCAQKAVTLDSNCPHAHLAMTYVGVLQGNRALIRSSCGRILQLNPKDAYMVGAGAFFLGLAGDFDRALALLHESIGLHPFYPSRYHFILWMEAFSCGDYEAALEEAMRIRMPAWFWDPLLRAATLGRLERNDEAGRACVELLRIRPDFVENAARYLGCFLLDNRVRRGVSEGLRTAGVPVEGGAVEKIEQAEA